MRVEYLNEFFEAAYPQIKTLLEQGRYRSVIFNLDQGGDSHVERDTLLDIMHSYPAAEIFYTFMISSLLAFLQKNQPEQLRTRLAHLGLTSASIDALNSLMSKNDWLGTAEKIVFDAFRLCAPYVSPFSINNPGGWRYWLIHFANAYRARQVYNNILHDNASLQAHFGRSGLNMLSYDPRHDEGMLYLFDAKGRASAKDQLLGDIPRLVTESGDAMSVIDFYESIYNVTPAHAEDVHAAIIENPDLEVITPAGGERRKANTIGVNDVIKVKTQRSFFPMFLNAAAKKKGSEE
ncbi:three-Cys-motif partner protein TcmP [Bradyrhizobium sp. CB1717]|uniref:three-Cys-motif partner protein TcmP n=1 Tax=Bradyrhizobium sp. CB1717 TaxID=3039154 RepID=UPI0024B2400B|nr:three-Cys-motif partner protein TcmP [Bradyrhizobium sp. CB1717]WFU25601.1 three-Cys-motif partner protein TcmP [Bradyrhizobium sp. CB1717]